MGEERSKGNQLVLEAARLLEAAPVRFIGNVEGRDLFHNVADVIVADGFVGNVVLKTGEGMIADLARVMRDALLGGNLLTKLGTAMLAPALKQLRKKFDYETYGGAPLLGLRGNCILTHGRASRNAIKHAIGAAVQEVEPRRRRQDYGDDRAASRGDVTTGSQARDAGRLRPPAVLPVSLPVLRFCEVAVASSRRAQRYLAALDAEIDARAARAPRDDLPRRRNAERLRSRNHRSR